MGFLDLFGNWRERRKHARHKVITTAWLRLTDGTVPHVCVLWDVSERGARLSVTDMDVVPTEFTLYSNATPQVERPVASSGVRATSSDLNLSVIPIRACMISSGANRLPSVEAGRRGA